MSGPLKVVLWILEPTTGNKELFGFAKNPLRGFESSGEQVGCFRGLAFIREAALERAHAEHTKKSRIQ